jgi:hypothetical protein
LPATALKAATSVPSSKQGLDGQTPAKEAGIEIEGRMGWRALLSNALKLVTTQLYLWLKCFCIIKKSSPSQRD